MTKGISIALLFPDLLGTYGDGGNAIVLERRLAWRDVKAEVIEVGINDDVPTSCDIYLLGGGEDQPQSTVADKLNQSRSLHKAVTDGAVVFAVCAGMQIVGESFAVAGDKIVAGLGLADISTVRGTGPRSVGEIVAHPASEIGNQLLTGYENHGGVTRLGASAKPLAKVTLGKGNGDGNSTEGFLQGKLVGTYLHGPVLARNPQLADYLLSTATGMSLQPLDDFEIELLRQARLSAANKRFKLKSTT